MQETTRLIQELLTSMSNMTDSCGVPLFEKERMIAIWQNQQKHISCIQDLPDVDLHTKVGSLKKGDVELLVYRCARGSMSLESFHLNRFIPGKEVLIFYSDSEDFLSWKEKHQDCEQDFDGSSKVMEAECTKRILGRSCEKYGLQYTSIVYDEVHEKDCVKYTDKRTSTALHK